MSLIIQCDVALKSLPLIKPAGDIRNILKTVSGLQNPEHRKKEVKKLRFLVNDIDPDIVARDIILLEIIHTLDLEKVQIYTLSPDE